MIYIITNEDSNKYGPFDAVVFATSDYAEACRKLAQVRKVCRARMVYQ